jgi:hypothetical protein
LEKRSSESDLPQSLQKELQVAQCELVQLRKLVERAVELGKAQAALSVLRSQREVALMKLGEVFLNEVEVSESVLTPELQRAYSEAKAKEVALQECQADISMLLKEADVCIEEGSKSSSKPSVAKKPKKK